VVLLVQLMIYHGRDGLQMPPTKQSSSSVVICRGFCYEEVEVVLVGNNQSSCARACQTWRVKKEGNRGLDSPLSNNADEQREGKHQ